jgi:hypothetical protein
MNPDDYLQAEQTQWLASHPHARLPVPSTAPEERLRIQQADDAAAAGVANKDAYEAAVLASKGM